MGCDGCDTIVESDKEVTFDASRHILPGDPAQRHIIGLTIADQARLNRFGNSLTALPIATWATRAMAARTVSI